MIEWIEKISNSFAKINSWDSFWAWFGEFSLMMQIVMVIGTLGIILLAYIFIRSFIIDMFGR